MFPMNAPKTAFDTFQALCTAAFDLQVCADKTHKSAKKRGHIAQSLLGLDQAAVALVPLVLEEASKKDRLYERALTVAATSWRSTIVEAFPTADLNTIAFDLNGPAFTKIARLGNDAFCALLQALRSRGYQLHPFYRDVVLRAIAHEHTGLQQIANAMAQEQGFSYHMITAWIFNLTDTQYTRSPAFFQEHLELLALYHPVCVQAAMQTAVSCAKGVPFVLLHNAHHDHTSIPTPLRASTLRTTLSAHAILALFGKGRSIAHFWSDRAMIAQAEALF